MNFPADWRSRLENVNQAVNALPYKSDAEQYGTPEFWESIDKTGAGDCEDYAIAKLRRLYDGGYPIQALKLAACIAPRAWGYQSHAVLVCESPEGRFVLSNGLPLMTQGRFLAEGFSPVSIQAEGGRPEWQTWAGV